MAKHTHSRDRYKSLHSNKNKEGKAHSSTHLIPDQATSIPDMQLKGALVPLRAGVSWDPRFRASRGGVPPPAPRRAAVAAGRPERVGTCTGEAGSEFVDGPQATGACC